jgi:hypothetical protein
MLANKEKIAIFPVIPTENIKGQPFYYRKNASKSLTTYSSNRKSWCYRLFPIQVVAELLIAMRREKVWW